MLELKYNSNEQQWQVYVVDNDMINWQAVWEFIIIQNRNQSQNPLTDKFGNNSGTTNDFAKSASILSVDTRRE